MSIPSVDHSMLSPSGHASKRARAAALNRAAAVLFPPGFWDKPQPPPAELARAKAASLRQTAANLRDLAARGMCPRRFPCEAAQLEAQAAALEAANP